MDVHLRDLRYFVAVAEELHFTRAAARLFVSQPALSKQIAQLERQVGARLLERDRRAVTLTPAGEALLTRARELLAMWDSAQHEVSAAAALADAVLVVGLSTGVARNILPDAMRRFAERRPGWRVQLRQVDWTDPTAGVADHGADVAYVWLPLPDPDRFGVRVVAVEPRHVALPAGHPLAAADRQVVAFADLCDEAFLALPAATGVLRDHWLAVEERHGRPVRVAGEVATADEALEAVAGGLGVVLLAEGNAAIYARPGVVTRPVSGLGPSRLALAWRRDDPRPAVRDFVEAHPDPDR
jgi:DNA-binding transcriptional LysR family regulator